MMPTRLVVLLTCVGLTACNAVLGLEERPAKEVAGGGIGGSGGGGLRCGATCIQAVPSGWSGPTAVTRGDPGVTCEGALANVELRLHDSLEAPPADCACACDAAEGVDCSAAGVELRMYDDNNCSNPEDTKTGVLGQCVQVCCGIDSGAFAAATPDTSTASCGPVTVSDSVPAVSWGEELLGCGPVERVPCAGDDCFAVPPASSLCVYQAGEHDCPEGPFSERQVWYAGNEDSRACEPCGCGAVDEASCNEVVVGYSDGNCNNNPGTLALAPSCTTAPVDFSSARVESVEPTGSCSPSGGAPVGAATPAEPTTVCCVAG